MSSKLPKDPEKRKAARAERMAIRELRKQRAHLLGNPTMRDRDVVNDLRVVNVPMRVGTFRDATGYQRARYEAEMKRRGK